MELLSPSSKNFLSKHGGKKDEEDSDDEVDDLLTLLERNPSEDSLRTFLKRCFDLESSVCATLGLKVMAMKVSHPRDFNDESWSVLNDLSAVAKAKNTLICKVIATCVEHLGSLLSLDFLEVLKIVDDFRETISEDFVLCNDREEQLPGFDFGSITEQAVAVDEAKGSHKCSKLNKDRLCLILKLTVEALLSRVVAFSAFSIKTPAKYVSSSESSSVVELRFQTMETNVTKLSSDLAAMSVKSTRESLELSRKVEANSDMVAALIRQLQLSSSPQAPVLPKPPAELTPGRIAAIDTPLSPAESLAHSGMKGLLSSVTTADSKGNEIKDKPLSCMFQCGYKPKSWARNAAFLETDCNLNNCLDTGRGYLPGISVEVVSPPKGELKDNQRLVVEVGSDSVVRKVSFLPPLSHSTSTKPSKMQVNLTSHDGLPRSLPLMIKFLYSELEALRLFVEYIPTEMDRLIESEIGKFVFKMSSLFSSMCDTSDPTICCSVDGLWRGLVHLFYHQYINAFSPKDRGMYQTFYPEMLCYGFDVNSSYLWRQYAWKTSQLTGAVHNYLRFSCPRCQLTKLSYSVCISASCVKSREEELTLHVFVDAKGKPLGAPAKA